VINHDNILNIHSSADNTYFYFPFSLYKKVGSDLKNTTNLKEKTKIDINSAREIL